MATHESIISCDPSGTTETAYFHFKSVDDWEFGTIDGENALEHGKKIDLLLKNTKPTILGWETSNNMNTKFLNRHYKELMYVNGYFKLLGNHIHNIPLSNLYEIYNLEVKNVIKYNKIPELEIRKIRTGKRGFGKDTWFFRDKMLSIHQKDALAVFYIIWTKHLKRIWPWIKSNKN